MATSAQVVVLPQGETSGALPQLEVRELQLPDPGPTQVVVRQYASGICHSQLHQMHRPRRRPTLLGHESTGIVVKKGAAVSHIDEGDTVLVTWVPRDAANASAPPAAATLDVGGAEAVSQNVFTWADHTVRGRAVRGEGRAGNRPRRHRHHRLRGDDRRRRGAQHRERAGWRFRRHLRRWRRGAFGGRRGKNARRQSDHRRGPGRRQVGVRQALRRNPRRERREDERRGSDPRPHRQARPSLHRPPTP